MATYVKFVSCLSSLTSAGDVPGGVANTPWTPGAGVDFADRSELVLRRTTDGALDALGDACDA